VTLILNPSNSKNIAHYHIAEDKVKFYNPRSSSNFIKRILNWTKLYKFICRNNFNKIIFNTASSNKEVIALTKFLPKRIQCFGIIHNLKKLNTSSSQKIINTRITNYYVLNDFLEDSAPLENKLIKLHSFYPIFYPKYNSIELLNKKNDVWVCIPGELNYNRRDYSKILNVLKGLNQGLILKIIILGKMNPNDEDAKSFMLQVNELNISEQIITFNHFISNEEFHSYIKQSDYIMAPVSLKEKSYLNYKITGAYNLAFAYKKLLICPEELAIIPDLMNNSVFYSDEKSLAEIFLAISIGKVIKESNYLIDKWSFKYQQKKYLELLESSI
ncbi:MAG: hypothetical protein NWP64_10990, partial [Maribacter sp.]|nr:hypothetical protein [Maribacter sp.]